MQSFTNAIDRITSWLGSPYALTLAIGFVVSWILGIPIFGLSDGYQLSLNSPTTALTFVMSFVILNGQNRSIKALHTKIDGLIAAQGADKQLENIEQISEEEIDALHGKITD